MTTFTKLENQSTAASLVASGGTPPYTWGTLTGSDAALFNLAISGGNHTTATITFKNPPDFENPTDSDHNNSYNVNLNVHDVGGPNQPQSITINVTNVYEAPTFDQPDPFVGHVPENYAGTFSFPVTADAGQTLQWQIVGGIDANKFTINQSTGELQFITPPDYENPTDAIDQNNLYGVTIRATDGTGNFAQKDVNIWVDNVNEPPVIDQFIAGIQIPENTTAVRQVQATDPELQNVTYSIVSTADGGGDDASKFTINSTTGELSFIAAPNFENPTGQPGGNVYKALVEVNDGSGGIAYSHNWVTVTNVDEPPVFDTTIRMLNFNENQTAVFPSTTATDPEGSAVTYSINPNVADAAAFDINSTTGELTFKVAPDYEHPTAVNHSVAFHDNEYIVAVQATDATGHVTSPWQTNYIRVQDVNEAPHIDQADGYGEIHLTVDEDAVNPVNIIDLSATDPDAGQTLTWSIVPTDQGGLPHGFLVNIDSATGQVTTNGPWNVSGDQVLWFTVQVDDGHGLTSRTNVFATIHDTWVNTPPSFTDPSFTAFVNENLSDVGGFAASDPDAGQQVHYSIVPNAGDWDKFTINEFSGQLDFISAPDFENPQDFDNGLDPSSRDNIYDVTIQADDQNGGTDTADVQVHVNDLNEFQPEFVGGNFATVQVPENTTAVTTVHATDQDPGQILTYELYPPNTPNQQDNDLFNIDSVTGELSFKNAPDFDNLTPSYDGDNIYDVTVAADDGHGAFGWQNIQVEVQNVNEAPSFDASTVGINMSENTTAVYTAQATDPDVGQALAYSILPNAGDWDQFTIDQVTGEVNFVTAPDFENPTDFDDGQGSRDGIYDITVVASDGEFTAQQDVQIAVDNENEAPVITSYGGDPGPVVLDVNENQTFVETVATVTATDVDPGQQITYSIDPTFGDAGFFGLSPGTGEINFSVSHDFEHPADIGQDNQYDVRVIAQDSSGSFDTQDFQFNVQDVNEAPVFDGNEHNSVDIVEGDTLVATVHATDQDFEEPVTYSILQNAGDFDKFWVDQFGEVRFITPPDFENPQDFDDGQGSRDNKYDVSVIATDSHGLTDQKDFLVEVNDLFENSPPVFQGGTSGGVVKELHAVENQTVLGSVDAIDPDAGQTLTYSILNGTYSSLFNINPQTGDISFVNAPDFENGTGNGTGQNHYEFDVQVDDGHGGIDTQRIDAYVHDDPADNNQPPTITSLATASVAENTTGVVRKVTATDPDPGQAMSFALIAGAFALDSDKFNINPTTGDLTFKVAPDYETPTDDGQNNVYNPTVQVSDGHGGVVTQQMAVTVTNVTTPNQNFPGTNGNDTFNGGEGNDTINGGKGNDTLNGKDGNDMINGGDGNDNIHGGNGNDLINGGAGNDTLFGDDGNDTILSGSGTDIIHGGNGDDILTSGGGNDTLFGDAGNDSLVGGTGADNLIGNAGNDTIFGNSGNDVLAAGPGINSVDGGTGKDYLAFAGSKADYTFSFTQAGGLKAVGTDGSITTIKNVEVFHFENGTNFTESAQHTLVAENATNNAADNAYLTAHGVTHDWLV